MVGLPEFVFHHNLLSGKFIECLSKILKNDRYCRKLDLSNNAFRAQDLDEEFFGSLNANETLINIDFRENTGYTPLIKKRVALNCLKNVEILKKSRVPVQKGWLDRDVLCLSKLEWPTLTKGLNFINSEDQERGVVPNENLGDTSTINLEVKSCKQRSRSNSKASKSPAPISSRFSGIKPNIDKQSNDVDMFNQNVIFSNSKNVDYSQINEIAKTPRPLRSNSLSDLHSRKNAQSTTNVE